MPDIDSFLADTAISEGSFDSTAVLNSLVGSNISKESLDQMLRHINLSRIPASLLLRIIHPLKIIPRGELLRALLHVALCRRVRYLPSQSDWRHGPYCKPGERGQIYCDNGDPDDIGVYEVAVAAFLPQARSSDVSEWSFEILEDDASGIDLGFFGRPVGQDFKDEMCEIRLPNFPSARILWISNDFSNVAISRKQPEMRYIDRDDWEFFYTQVDVGSVVNFKLNKLEKTCRVQFNAFEAVWDDLPDGDYYIAAGFSGYYISA